MTTPLFPLTVTHDAEAPTVHADFPGHGAEVTNETITIAGRVSDRLSGYEGLVVTVNGEPADVIVGLGANGTFERQGIPLDIGTNEITITATDAHGTQATKTVSIIREQATGIQMRRLSGDGQMGTVHQSLPDPLVARIVKTDGTPLVGKLVTFQVIRSDGVLADTTDGLASSTSQKIQVTTNSEGMASTFWKLGGDAGCGNHRVAVYSRDVDGTVFFCASANAGADLQLNLNDGDGQILELGAKAPRNLTVWLNDSCNPVAGTPITFTVLAADGLLNGARHLK